MTIDAQLSYLSGGPAAGAPVKFRSRIVPSSQSFRITTSSASAVRCRRLASKPKRRMTSPRRTSPKRPAARRACRTSRSTQRRCARRLRQAVVGGQEATQQTRALEVEMEYADPNGQILTAFTQTLLTPSALVVGLAPDGSFFKRDSLRFKAVVLDNAGKPQAGKDVSVDAYSRTRFAYRKRLLGGFYAYEQTVEVKRLKQVCRGTTDARGLVLCSGLGAGERRFDSGCTRRRRARQRGDRDTRCVRRGQR